MQKAEKPARENRASTPRPVNRLKGEKSPYLEQHAHNPVDWYPWGEEAFEKATREDKPVFLSIGYATCHWCHVMERESFEDTEVAELLNENFVSIKVDREERPEIDNIYMSACQLMTGGGGWPLTVFMTPDKKPFFAGTYFPRDSVYGHVGMTALLPKVASLWRSNRSELVRSAENLTDVLERAGEPSPTGEPSEELLHEAFRRLKSRFDSNYGGFGDKMKFPAPHQIVFLLRYFGRTGNPSAREMAESTLVAMRRGGIFDHVGFGFHRYSTDPEWIVPHFEKMLYDQALLLLAYTEAYAASGKELFARTAREIAEYVLRDLRSPQGAFYSAEDADSEGEEGRFYTFEYDELAELLSDEELRRLSKTFNLRPEGNYAEEATREPSGRNILHLEPGRRIRDADATHEETPAGGASDEVRKRLLAARSRRPRPLRDEKILADWNGLMIGALAYAGRVLGEGWMIDAASGAAQFIGHQLVDNTGRLLHRHRDGESKIPGFLDDYAFFSFGLLELYQATLLPQHLAEALRLIEVAAAHFYDSRSGGFHLSADDEEEVLVRTKELYDGALPSGNSIMAHNLSRLTRIVDDPELKEIERNTSRVLSRFAIENPLGNTGFLAALDGILGPKTEVSIVNSGDDTNLEEFKAALAGLWAPGMVVLRKTTDTDAEAVSGPLEAALKAPPENEGEIQVCTDSACSLPTTDIGQMLAQIRRGLNRTKSNPRGMK